MNIVHVIGSYDPARAARKPSWCGLQQRRQRSVMK